jgi:hypothetical protein
LKIKDYYINWPKVAQDYSGIEICPYQWKFRLNYMWYYGWDVASGCIWNQNALNSTNVIAEFNPKLQKYEMK